MERIAQRDWLKMVAADGADSEVDTKTLLLDGTIVICVCAKGDRGVPAHRSRRVDPAEILKDGRKASFDIEDGGSVSLLVGEGERPRFAPRVRSVYMDYPTTIHLTKWIEDRKGVRNIDCGDQFKMLETRLVGFRIADDNRICRVLVDDRFPWGWDRCSYTGERGAVSLTNILHYTYGLVLDYPEGGCWGRGHTVGRDTAYFNEHGDVVFDASPLICHVNRDYFGDYFKDGKGHPFVSV